MGIQGLLPLLKSIMVPIHIRDLEGCTVAVDTYSWLHKGALSCSKELCKGLPTSKHIDYCMCRVNLLRHHRVKPILVFDGGLLPMKIEQENKRSRVRKENLARAIEHESNGNSAAAYECYQKAVDISPSVANELIQVLKREDVCYVVAPYEADAQMTFLKASNQADAVLTEDSDLIAFGCSRIIYKMDKYGQGVEFRHSRLEKNKDLNFTGFNIQMLLEMCILSGCDYLQSLPGMGLKKAHALIKKFRSYDKVIKHLKYSSVAVSSLYEESFWKAILTFKHQRVYDIVSEDIVHLSELPDNYVGKDWDFLGPELPQHIGKGIASGVLDPLTKMPFQQGSVTGGLVNQGAYQLKNFKPNDEGRKVDLPVQKNLLTNYFCFASLEAKRKFRAPRVTPKPPSPMNLCSFPGDVNKDDDSHPLNLSSTNLHPRNLGICPPEGDLTDNYGIMKASLLQNIISEVSGNMNSQEQTLLLQSDHSMNKPCIISHQKREDFFLDAGGSVRTEKRNVTVKSRYFEHKLVRGNDQKECENVSVNDSSAIYMHDNTLSEQEYNTSEGGPGNVVLERSKVKLRRFSKDYSSIETSGTILKCEYKSSMDKEECKTRADTWKPSVSHYFKHKTLREDYHDDIYEKQARAPLVENGKYLKDTIMKRKVSLVENDCIEIADHKYMCTYFPPDENNSLSSLEVLDVNKNSEPGKFGCNISHLSQYSGIAQKSMESFVSVLSKFKCTSSGSRASGLRAPLKDIKNNCTKRSTVGMDINDFVYLPKKRKTSSTPY